MYLIDIKTLTAFGDISKLLRDEVTEEIIIFESLDQAIKWCTNNNYGLYTRLALDDEAKNHTYKYRKNTGNETSFAYIYKCKNYK